MTMPLEWTYLADEVREHGKSETRHATDDELIELARALDILSCESLTASYQIRPLPAGNFRFDADVMAKVTQACVVTLEPVPAAIQEHISIELRPEPEVGSEDDEGDGDREILGLPDYEVISGGRIDAGALVFEALSTALDPYPRRDGVEFDWVDPKRADPATSGAFADLSKWKPKT